MVLSLILSAALFFSFNKSVFRDVNWLIYDLAESLRSPSVAENTILVEIDDLSIKKLGRWPWSRDKHAELIRVLTEAGAQTIVFDVLFADLDQANLDADTDLKSQIEKSARVILPMHIERLGIYGQLIEVPPAEPFYLAAAGVGHVHVEQDRNGIVRSVFLKEGLGTPYWPHLSLAALQFSNPTQFDDYSNLSLETEPNPMLIVRDYPRYIPSNAQASARFSYFDVLTNNIDTELLKGKTVFVGATATGIGDRVVTPIGQINGVEFNLWIYHSIKHERTITAFLDSFNVLACLIVFFGLIGLGRLNPRAFLFVTLLLSCSLVIGSLVFQLFFYVWFPVSNYLAVLFLFYPYWSWLRLDKAVSFMRKELRRLKSDVSDELGSAALVALNSERSLGFLKKIGCVETWQYTEPGVDQSGSDGSMQNQVYRYRDSNIRIRFTSQFSNYLNQDQLRKNATTAMISDVLDGAKPQTQPDEIELVTQLIAQISDYQKRYQRIQSLHEQSLDKLQDAILIADVFGGIHYINRACLNIAEISKRDDLLEALNAVAQPEDQTWEVIVGRLFAGENFLSGSAFRDDGKKEYLYQLRLAKIFYDVADTLIVSFTDVSELRRVQREKEEALNFLSHDLRSPLVTVMSLLQNRSTGNTAKLFDDIGTLVERNLRYADDYLHLSKAKSVGVRELSLVDMHGVLDQALAQALVVAKSKNIEIECRRCNDDAWTKGDASLLERALLNIISNAVKYSPEQSKVVLTLEVKSAEVIVSVADSGPGMAKGEIDTIFSRFSTGLVSKKSQQMSAGLGLYFVDTVVKSHSGRIKVESMPNQGAVFSLFFPLSELD